MNPERTGKRIGKDLPRCSTQDPFLVLAGRGGEITLLTSKDFERADDRMMAVVIARHAGYQVKASALKEDPRSVAAFEAWCEEHFFGDPAIHELTGVDGPITAPDVRDRTGEMIEKSRAKSVGHDRLHRASDRWADDQRDVRRCAALCGQSARAVTLHPGSGFRVQRFRVLRNSMKEFHASIRTVYTVLPRNP